jgi:hypothetical protein
MDCECALCFLEGACKEVLFPFAHSSLQGESIVFGTLPVCEGCLTSVEQKAREVLKDFTWKTILNSWHAAFPNIRVQSLDEVCLLIHLAAIQHANARPRQ